MRVFGVGLGIFVLTLVWIVSLFACLGLSRSQGLDGAIAPTVVALVISLILIFFPRQDDTELDVKVDVEIVDHLFIPRILLLVIMCLVLLVASIALIATHLTKPVHARALPNRQKRVTVMSS